MRVDGFDNDEPSIELARLNAAAAGVADRVHFYVQDVSQSFGAVGSYDLVAAFVMLHDVAQPVETLRAMRRLAGEDGTVIVLDMRVADTFTAPGDPTAFQHCRSMRAPRVTMTHTFCPSNTTSSASIDSRSGASRRRTDDDS